jgi:hypothetical protein
MYRSNDITLATPKIRAFWPKFQKACLERYGIHVVHTNIARDIHVQAALYAQGRESLPKVNVLRMIAGLPAILDGENKYCVTWTMKSKHIIDREDQLTTNDYSHAIDWAIERYPGHIIWDVKVDINSDKVADYIQCAKLVEVIDPTMVSGYKWRNPDIPHIQDIA